MKKILALILLIPSALNAMDEIPSAQKPKPVEIRVQPVFGHLRADKNQKTIDCATAFFNGNSAGRFERQPNSYSYDGTQLTLTEIIPNDAAQQLTVLFSLKPHENKPAYQGIVIAGYDSTIPLGDQQSDVRYTLNIPSSSVREPDPCDCATQEHHNDLTSELALVLAPQPAESYTEQLRLSDDETVSEGKE